MNNLCKFLKIISFECVYSDSDHKCGTLSPTNNGQPTDISTKLYAKFRCYFYVSSQIFLLPGSQSKANFAMEHVFPIPGAAENELDTFHSFVNNRVSCG